MTVTVTGTVQKVNGTPDRSKWVFSSVLRESGDGDATVSPTLVVATPNVDGILTVELDPGPVVVKYGNTSVAVTVPDVDVDLWDLIGASVLLPPVTTDQKLLTAFLAFLQAHPVGADELAAAVQASLTKADSAVQPAALTTAINAVLDDAPGALNTLNELAAALGDDANFAATVTAALTAASTELQTVDSSIRADVTGAILGVNSRIASWTGADAYIDFTTKPNGDPPAVLDTGQPVDFVLQNVSNWKPQISSGKLIRGTLPASGNYADYYQAQLDGDVRAGGCRWTVNTADGSTEGFVCLAAWESVYESAGTVVPKTPAHITFSTTTGAWAWWVSDGGGTGSTRLKTVKSGTFTPPASDGSAIWECAYYIDPDNGIAYLYLPGNDATTGSRIVTVTDAEIATLLTAQSVPVTTLAATLSGADVLMVEHFATAAANTARFPRYLDMWGETTKSIRNAQRTVHERGVAGPLLAQVASSVMTMVNKTLTNPKINNINDTNGAAALNISATASAVNSLLIASAIATGQPSIRATGADTNISLNLRGKGTGGVTIGSSAMTVATTDLATVSTATTLAAVANHHYMRLLNTGAAVTLPTAVGNTSIYTLKNITTGNLAIATTSSQTIEGAVGYTLAAGESITIVSTQTNWVIL